MHGLILTLTLLTPSARAAAPYAEDAAAAAAFFASSVTLTSKAVAVPDLGGDRAVSVPLTHRLRTDLLRLGAQIVQPDAPYDYVLRGEVFRDGDGLRLYSELWDKTGRLAAGHDRKLGLPPHSFARLEAPKGTAQVGAQAPPRRRLWNVSAGPHIRSETIGWLAGVLLTCPTERWEGGIDIGNYGSDKEAVKLGIPTINRTDVWHARLRGGRLFPVTGNGLLDGWLPSSAVLRAGIGVAALKIGEKVIINQGAPRENNETFYLRPLIEAGVRLKVTRRIALDLGADWIPDLIGPGNVNRGGFAAAVRLHL